MKTKAKISFGIMDVTAKQDSQLNANNKQEFVNMLELKKDDLYEVKYATLEKNHFVLDGSRELISNEIENVGWWSKQMSNEEGNFATPLILEINFNEMHSSLGLTLVFSEIGDYCNNLSIKYYDINNNLISERQFMPNKYKYVCNDIVENYTKIVITFYSTNNPLRYLKLYKILYGAEKVFEGDNLMNASILEEVDLLSSEISINTLDFTVYSDEDDFNIINPKGLYSLLQQRQKLQVTETLIKENKEKNMGTFYLDDWSNEKNKIMKFKAIDLIGIIDKTNFNGGMYDKITFKDLIAEIMTSAGLTEEQYEIEESLKNVLMTGYIPICSHRSALQQASFVVCAVVDCSRSDKIKIYRTKNSNTKKRKITKSDYTQGTRELKQNALVSTISMTIHTYKKDKEEVEELTELNIDKELEKLCTYTLDDYGVYVLTFNEPAYQLVATTDLKTKNVMNNVTFEIDYGIIVSSTCNTATIEYSKDVTYKQIAIGATKKRFFEDNSDYYKEENVYFREDYREGAKIYTSARDMSNTQVIEEYIVDMDKDTITSTIEEEKTTIFVAPEIEVSIYGLKYTHNKTQYQAGKPNSKNSEGENILKIESAYLLNTTNMKAVANHILNYYTNTFEDTFEMILQDENIADAVELKTDFNEELSGNIVKLDIDLTGGFIGKVKVIDKMKEDNNNG